MPSQKYIPVHLRNKSSFQSNSNKTFEEEFPDLLNNSNLNTSEPSQNAISNTKYNEIYSKEGEIKNSNQLPKGWVELNNYKKSNQTEFPIWEQRKMQDKYLEGLEFMDYIQDQNQEFIDTFIYQNGINEYLRLYKCDFNEDSESENEYMEEVSESESDEDYEY